MDVFYIKSYGGRERGRERARRERLRNSERGGVRESEKEGKKEMERWVVVEGAGKEILVVCTGSSNVGFYCIIIKRKCFSRAHPSKLWYGHLRNSGLL